MEPGDRTTGRPAPTPGRGRRLVRCAAAAALLFLPAACKSSHKYELIEAELRTRERELAETRAALDQARLLNRACEQGRAQPDYSGAPAAQRRSVLIVFPP